MVKKKPQLEMIHDLACKVHSNLQWKHVVLSVEEKLVDFLMNDFSHDGILELEPMSSYDRHLVHCLADIYELEHESVGEGDDRHMILEQCWNSSIPFVRVSDYLWLLRRKHDVPDTTLDLICRYDGEMEILSNGKVEYVGGETKMRSCSINTEYNDFVKILEEVSQADPDSMIVSFRNYVSGYACKIDSVSDYASMMNKHRRNPLQPIIIWIFKEDEESMEDDSDNSSGSVGMDVVDNTEDDNLVGD